MAKKNDEKKQKKDNKGKKELNIKPLSPDKLKEVTGGDGGSEDDGGGKFVC